MILDRWNRTLILTFSRNTGRRNQTNPCRSITMTEQNPHHQRIGAVRGSAALLLLAGAFGAGAYFRDPLLRLVSSSTTMEEKKDAAQQQHWTCSMHPQVIRDGPGFCPICHMALTPM